MKRCEICGGSRIALKLRTIYVHFVESIKESTLASKELTLHIIYVVVIIQIEGIAHGARNHVIMIRP